MLQTEKSQRKNLSPANHVQAVRHGQETLPVVAVVITGGMKARRTKIACRPRASALRIAAAAALSLALLSACTGTSGDYPSFTIPTSEGDSGRVSVQFPGVSATTPIDPATIASPLPQDLDAAIVAISARAERATQAFSANANQVRTLADRARGASVTSDIWADAQVRLADLTSHHSDAHLALADLDLLAAQAEITLADAQKSAAIAQAQSRLAATLVEQDLILAAIAARLDR